MKKWQKACIIIVIIAGILCGAGYGIYKVTFEPKVEQALEKAQTVLNNEAFQDEVDKFVQEMIDSGVLEDADIQNYVQFKTSRDEKQAAQSENAEGAADSGGAGNSGKPDNGAETADAGETNTTSKAVPDAQKTSGKSAPADPGAAPATPKPSKSTKLIDRVKEAMTPEEFSFAMSVYGKLDVGYVTSNMNSNREEVKEYVKSVLSSSEISRCIDIYGKYSYLLSE